MPPNASRQTSTCQGLKALGLPQESLDSFPTAFKEGMAARAALLGDVGESAPEHREAPLGSSDVHLALAALSPDAERLASMLERVQAALHDLAGVAQIWQQDVYALPNERTSFGFKDGISHPAVEGSGIPGSNPLEPPIKAGEFVLGYHDQAGDLPPMPFPDVLGQNGTCVVFRELQTRVAAYRQYLRANARSRAEEDLLAAKFVGRWPSGAPLMLAPEQNDPALGADPKRNNAFLYQEADPRGLKCPFGAHARRMNARDATIVRNPSLHRMIRRGIVFAFVGAHLERQFEFVKTQWINDGVFIGAPSERDPLVGPNDGTGQFTIPQRPIRRRLPNLPQFVVNRGGEYCFMPGLRALRWLSELDG